MTPRSALFGSLLLVVGTIIGASTQHLASADDPPADDPVLVPITPCRLADTRPAPNNVGGRTSPLGTGDTMVIDAIDVGVPCEGSIPAEAVALSLNVTALNATEGTFLTVFGPGSRPLAANLNPAPGEPPTPNAVYVQLDDESTFQIYNESGSVDVVVDANGYYVGHDHDELYPSQEEFDQLFQRLVFAEREGAQMGFDTATASFVAPGDSVDDVVTVQMQSDPFLGRRLVVATAVVHVNTSGDQESNWKLHVDDGGGGAVDAVDRDLVVVTPAPSSTNPADTITMMTSVIQEAGDTHTFSVSGTQLGGVPLANIEVDLSVVSTYLDETTTPPGP